MFEALKVMVRNHASDLIDEIHIGSILNSLWNKRRVLHTLPTEVHPANPKEFVQEPLFSKERSSSDLPEGEPCFADSL